MGEEFYSKQIRFFFEKKNSGGEDIFSEKKGSVDLFLKRKRAFYTTKFEKSRFSKMLAQVTRVCSLVYNT